MNMISNMIDVHTNRRDLKYQNYLEKTQVHLSNENFLPAMHDSLHINRIVCTQLSIGENLRHAVAKTTFS